jgi:hypothetical protein
MATKSTRTFKHNGSFYCPLLDKDGFMDIRTGVAYDVAGTRRFKMTIYVKSVLRGSKSVENYFDTPAKRWYIDQGESEATQLKQLEFECNILATQFGLDYKLRLPHNPRATPKSYYKGK